MSEKILYIEPFSGASGDMLLSALCSLTDQFDLIESLPNKLNLPDGKIVIQELTKNGIVCKHVKIVDLNGDAHNHDHHHDHSHDHTHDHDGHGHHHHDHQHHHHHEHEDHDHQHEHLDHAHHHRGLKEINQIIEAGDISANAKAIAKEIFLIIGESEAKIHNIPLETIHFHEVSGVDSILDIVGCAVLLDLLDVNKTYCDPICTGFGTVKTQHGLLPIPAPATFDIAKDLPLFKGDEKGEKLTPTGAAIIKYLNPDFAVPTLRRLQTSYGPGQKDFKNPNVIRISLIEPVTPSNLSEGDDDQTMIKIECNLDDTRAELLGHDFQERLLATGAVDFYFSSTQMKKARPGLKLEVLAPGNLLEKITAFILEETSTIGLRYHYVYRKILPRTQVELDSPYGKIIVKESILRSGEKRQKIEFESIKVLAVQHNKSPAIIERDLYQWLANH